MIQNILNNHLQKILAQIYNISNPENYKIDYLSNKNNNNQHIDYIFTNIHKLHKELSLDHEIIATILTEELNKCQNIVKCNFNRNNIEMTFTDNFMSFALFDKYKTSRLYQGNDNTKFRSEKQ